jgi:hypothetical protein
MLNARKIIAILLAAHLVPTQSFARENPGTTAAPILQVPVGARAAAMGSAFTAVADDLSTLYYNPGGLSTLMSRETTFMYMKGLEDQNLEYIAGATPLSFAGLIGEGYTSVAASILFSQNGSIEVNRTNPNGSFLDSRTLSAGGDIVMTLGYSERIFESEIDRPLETYHINQSMGITGKFIRSTLAEEFSATAMAADLGYLLVAPELGIRYGLAILNIGSKMTFIDEGDPLPLTFRSGFAYKPQLPDRLLLPGEQSVSFALDGEYLTHERQWHVNLGTEYTVMRLYSLRLGYQVHRDLTGLTTGFGVRWRGFQIDYAWALTEALSDAHRFSFTYRFGRIPAYKREFRRRPFIESMPDREDLRRIEDETPRTLDKPRRPRRQAPDRRAAPGWIY